VDKRTATEAALLFALSPYVFLFTTVVYAEGLFLLLTLSSWYFFKKKRTFHAAALGAAATIARPPGLLISLPMILECLREKAPLRIRNMALSCLPLLSFFMWLTYCRLTANDWLATVHTTDWHGYISLPVFLFKMVPAEGGYAFLAPLPNPLHWLAPLSIWGAFLISPFLVYKMLSADRSLAVYSSVYYLSILVFGAVASAPRFLSFLFPLWLPTFPVLFKKRWSTPLIAVILLSSYLIGLDLWVGFLSGQFIA